VTPTRFLTWGGHRSFQSEELILATYHNAGVRAFDISIAHEPKKVGHFMPDAPENIVDFRPGAECVALSTEVLAAADGTLSVTDSNGGLTVWAYQG
jgi:hypothetical protein